MAARQNKNVEILVQHNLIVLRAHFKEGRTEKHEKHTDIALTPTQAATLGGMLLQVARAINPRGDG